MTDVIKFCPCNFPDEFADVREQLKRLPDLTVVDDFCLLYCGQCLVQPFALVNKKNVIGDTPKELLDNILAALGRA
ncbi:UNVERIFIED_CONTAM: uncharacterized protein YuzB (UPF0349 family) [Brevibacillus sp. OAP136]